MTPDAQALDLLASKDADGAVNIVSRQGASTWVAGCVKLAKHKYSDAATLFFEAQQAPVAVAVALLEPFQQFARLTNAQGLPADLEEAVTKTLSLQLADRQTVTTIQTYLPREASAYVDVARKIAEYNVLCVSRVAETVFVSTLQQVVGAVGEFDAEEVVGSLIGDERLNARIDQVTGMVEFCIIDQNARQTAHLQGLLDRVEQLTAELAK